MRRGDELFAVSASCTHYHGPLADGLVVGDTVRCPWHHACFSLRTGEALRAPALDPIGCWRVERSGDTLFVREKLAEPRPTRRRSARDACPASVVIVGGGRRGARGRGHAASRRLRRHAHDDQRGRLAALRPAEPLEGLPRRHGARRLDPAALARSTTATGASTSSSARGSSSLEVRGEAGPAGERQDATGSTRC